MSKVIKSPVDHFAGEVTLSDPLTFPQVFAVEDSVSASKALGEDATVARYHHAALPGLLECVEKWNIKGISESVTADTFPATPRTEIGQIINWLMAEVIDLYEAGEPDPEA